MKAARAGRGRKREGGGPLPVAAALQGLLHQLGITTKMQQYRVITSWESIVGERIARVAEARRIENGVLFVEVKTAPWRHELAMRKHEIMDKIHRATGKKLLKDIRFH